MVFYSRNAKSYSETDKLCLYACGAIPCPLAKKRANWACEEKPSRMAISWMVRRNKT